ncbi:MAG: hypothetical protein ACM359_22205, partial [Bacillota bacterium]
GAKPIGVVFNRAEPTDFYQSVQMTSLRSSVPRQVPAGAPRTNLQEPSRLGPVVRSVESLLPPGNGDPQT